MSKTEDKLRVRKKPARRPDVVMACLTERLFMIPMTDDIEPHRARLIELIDELGRAISKNAPESEPE